MVQTDGPHIIEVVDLVKGYGSFRAVDGVSLSVRRGEILGILGPNGAGKTTLIETIVGMREPSAGQVRVCGLNPHLDRASLTERVAVQPQTGGLLDHLTVAETLDLFASLYPSPIPTAFLLTELGLESKASGRVTKLSGGQRQRLLLGVALVGNTDLLVLDEPTGSLDPQARRQLWEIIRGRRAKEQTVVLTTHSMEEAAALCDRIAIMHKGRILALGRPAELIREFLPEQMIVYEAMSEPYIPALKALPGVENVIIVPAGDRVTVRLRTRQADETLLALLSPVGGLRPERGFQVEQATLEDLFLLLVSDVHQKGEEGR